MIARFLFASLLACFAFAGIAADRPVIERKDDLPRHTYQMNLPVVELYAPGNRAELLRLAREVARDVRNDLATYDIRDDNTVQGFYSVLGNVAILEGRWQEYLGYLEKRRELESKEANRLTMGLFGEALAHTRLAAPENATQALRADLARRVNALPYATVQDNIKASKGSSEIVTEALVGQHRRRDQLRHSRQPGFRGLYPGPLHSESCDRHRSLRGLPGRPRG